MNSIKQDLFTSKIDFVQVLIYNSSGKLVSCHNELQDNLLYGNTYVLPALPQDYYTFIVWANTSKERYKITDSLSLNNLRIVLQPLLVDSNLVDPRLDSFFHGIGQANIADLKGGQPLYISLTNNTHLFRIVVEETQTTLPINLSSYTVEFTGTNGTYNYKNNTVGNNLLYYKPSYNLPQKHSLQMDYTSLRITENSDLHIKIYDEKRKLLYDEPILQLLLKSPTINTFEDLDRIEEYTLKFTVLKNNSSIDIELVGVNDWNVIDQNSGL